MSNENIEIGENSGGQSAQADTGHFYFTCQRILLPITYWTGGQNSLYGSMVM